MAQYLGETRLPSDKGTPFEGFSPTDWALYFIDMYAQIDGEYHHLWVLDQVARILRGTSIIIKLAKWDDGTQEYRVSTGVPSEEYKKTVKKILSDGYDWNEGIAP